MRLPAQLTLLLLVVITGATFAPSASAVYGRSCGHVSVGYTSATVKSDGVRCRKARRIVRRWVRNSDEYCDNYGYCEPVYIRGFRCVKGGSGYIVALRCRDGDRRVKATWGD